MCKNFTNDNPFGVAWDRFDDQHHKSKDHKRNKGDEAALKGEKKITDLRMKAEEMTGVPFPSGESQLGVPDLTPEEYDNSLMKHVLHIQDSGEMVLAVE